MKCFGKLEWRSETRDDHFLHEVSTNRNSMEFEVTSEDGGVGEAGGNAEKGCEVSFTVLFTIITWVKGRMVAIGFDKDVGTFGVLEHFYLYFFNESFVLDFFSFSDVV